MSVMVIVCIQFDALPPLSVAVQVLLMPWFPAQFPPALPSLLVMLAMPLQSSVAVALPVFEGSVDAEQSIVTLAGQLIVGPCVSVLVIV